MRRVLIGTPCLTGQVDAHYANSLVSTARLLMQHNIDMRELIICYESILQVARNDILAAVVNKGFDDVVMIDDDQEWQPEWVLKLLSYPVDCVGGTVRKKTDQVELYNVKHSSVDIPIDPATGLMVVDGLGAGFMRLSRAAVDLLWNEAPVYHVWGKEPSRWIFDIKPDEETGELIGEDIRLSYTLAKYGVKTYLDPTMTCNHIGVKKYSGDFQRWLSNMQARKRAEEAAAAV